MATGVSTGLNFGLTSGVITTLGLIVGLHAGTQSLLAVIGGVITIAVADGMSDALGIHISKEAENTLSTAQLWVATGVTFAAKFLMALSFLVPILLLPLNMAVWVSIGWGMLVITLLSFGVARSQREGPALVIAEHLSIALVVVVLTHLLGQWVASMFGA